MKKHKCVVLVLVMCCVSSVFAKGSLKQEFDSILKRADNDSERDFYRKILKNPAKPTANEIKIIREFGRELTRWSKLSLKEQQAEQERDREANRLQIEKDNRQWEKDKIEIAKNNEILEQHMQAMETPEETEARHAEIEREADEAIRKSEQEMKEIEAGMPELENLIKAAEDALK